MITEEMEQLLKDIEAAAEAVEAREDSVPSDAKQAWNEHCHQLIDRIIKGNCNEE